MLYNCKLLSPIPTYRINNLPIEDRRILTRRAVSSLQGEAAGQLSGSGTRMRLDTRLHLKSDSFSVVAFFEMVIVPITDWNPFRVVLNL